MERGTAALRPREILDHPGVRIYAEDWGARPGDVGVIGEIDGQVAGACWMRLVTGGMGMGYVDDETPQLGIALFPPFQRRGHGEPLMRAALDAARAHGYPRVSLTVHPQNPAIALYERCGFVKREIRDTYHLMVRSFADWFMYVIECQDGSLYTGIATDPKARYQMHVAGKGARYTRSHPPARLVMTQPYPDRSSALKAEYQFKQLPAAEKRRLASI